MLLALAAGESVALAGDEPWPFWGRTADRQGNTTTLGPRAPVVQWTIEIDPSGLDVNLWSSAVMDEKRRIFCGNAYGLTAVDSVRRSVLWLIENLDTPGPAPAVRDGRVFWGYTTNGSFFCTDAATGEEIWRVSTPIGFDMSPVLDEDGVVHFVDRDGTVYARWAHDGTEVWTSPFNGESYASPTYVSEQNLLAHRGPSVQRFDPTTGRPGWAFSTFDLLYALTPHAGGRFYVGSQDDHLYCIDAETGEEVWSFDAIKGIRGAVAIGHDGTIYFGNTGGGQWPRLYAFRPDGVELWRYEPGGNVWSPPIVGGDGSVYFCTTEWTGSSYIGRVHALDPADGSELWVEMIDDALFSSPMLAPDGTLYVVCSDKNLYAFRDPSTTARLTDFTVAFGTHLDGGLDEVAESDDVYLRTRSKFGFAASEPNLMQMVLGAQNAVANPRMIDVTVESRIDNPGGVAKVRLRNWTTGQFEGVWTYALDTEDDTLWLTGFDAANRVRNIDQRIEVSIKHVVIATFSLAGFQSFFDLVEVATQ